MKPFDAVIESYYLETQEGLLFAVKGLQHPPDRIISVVRYAPDPERGGRKRAGVLYRRLYHFAEQKQLLQSSYPRFLKYDPIFHATLQSVPKSAVRQIYDPRLRLQEMARNTAATAIEKDGVAFAQLLQKESGVPLSAIGISGSLLIGLHTEQSDLDISVFGMQSCRKVYDNLGRLLESQQADDLHRFGMEGIRELYDQRIADTQMPFDEFAAVERNKICQGSFRRRPYFIRFIKEPHESGERYGDVRYAPLGRAIVQASIADDHQALFTPCRYTLSNVDVLEGPKIRVDEIVSFRGRFCEQARTGDAVRAVGLLERMETSKGKVSHRLLLGNSPEDVMVPSNR